MTKLDSRNVNEFMGILYVGKAAFTLPQGESLLFTYLQQNHKSFEWYFALINDGYGTLYKGDVLYTDRDVRFLTSEVIKLTQVVDREGTIIFSNGKEFGPEMPNRNVELASLLGSGVIDAVYIRGGKTYRGRFSNPDGDRIYIEPL
jgi:hypothetical protein